MECPKCQHDNPPDTVYCGKCATPLPHSEDIKVSQTETIETPKEELTTGSTFAGRYQIIEELGRGGMGRVYKATDTRIREKVALKLIKPDIASDKKTLERFGNELKMARKITHKNVGKMFDINDDKGTHYITMEYVEGENLKNMIRMSRQLGIGTTLPIAKQICEGLAEAHRIGVIHRDLKPSNIMIDREGNARIMDFGIARSLKEKGITGAGVMIGTPDYMSPEQAEAKGIDQRSDIYSLGVILYEMVTGRVPFEGDTALSIAVKHKTETPKDPKEYNAQIPDDLSKVILQCLEKDKNDRYQSAEELADELGRLTEGIPTTERVPPKKKPLTSKEITVSFELKKVLIPVLAFIAIVVIGVILWRVLPISKQAGEQEAVIFQKPEIDPDRIAVAVFENRTGNADLDHLGQMAQDWITQGLQQIEGISVAGQVPEKKSEEGEKETDFVQWVSYETYAGKVVTGAYYLQKNTLQFHSKVHDAIEGKMLHALEPVSGSIEKPLETIETLRQKVMTQLVIISDPIGGSFQLMGAKLPSYEAYREFMEGRQLVYRRDREQAIEHFKKAIALDPDFFRAYYWMAYQYRNLGNRAEASDVLEKLEQHRDKLSPMTRFAFDLAKAVVKGDWAEAYRKAREGMEIAPFTTWGSDFAAYAIAINRPREAIKALKACDPERGGLKGWVEYWWGLTFAHHMLGEHEQELEEAQRGRKQYPERIGPLFYEIQAQAALGRIEEVYRLIDESLNLLPQPGGNPGGVMRVAASELKHQGHKDEALEVLNRAIKWYRGRPKEEASTASARFGLAWTYYFAEMWDEAKPIFEALHKEYPKNMYHHGFLGSTLARMGDTEGVLKISGELEKLDDPNLLGWPNYWRAVIAADLGDKEGAMRFLHEALAKGLAYWDLQNPFLHDTLDKLWDYPPFQELIKPKG